MLKISRVEVFSKQERPIRSQTRCYHRTDRQFLACWTTNMGDKIEAICQSPQFPSFTFNRRQRTFLLPCPDPNLISTLSPVSSHNSWRPHISCARDVTKPNPTIASARPLYFSAVLSSLAGTMVSIRCRNVARQVPLSVRRKD